METTCELQKASESSKTYKLEHYDFRGNIPQLPESYSNIRKQYVCINNTMSSCNRLQHV